MQVYITYGGGDLRIGADRSPTGGPAYFWRGSLDEVRIWANAIDFSVASGLLYRIPHGVVNGRWGKYLVAGWRLNGTTTEITGRHHGTLVGSATFSASPDPPHYARIGAVFTNKPGGPDVGGSQDYFEVRTSSTISLVQNYTLECWVKPSAQNGHTNYQTFLEKGSKYASAYTYWLGLYKKNNTVLFIPNGDFSNGMESSISIPIGQWTHVAARYQTIGKDHIATIFINGVKRGSKTYTSLATANSWPLYIGRSDGANAPLDAYGYPGVIDEVRLWNVPRSDDQIADNYLLEFDGVVSGLVADYRFDGDVLDHSGYGNNGNYRLDYYSDIYFESTMTLPPFPVVRVTDPNGGERATINQVYPIKWQSSGLINVKIELSRDGGGKYETIVPSTDASKGSYDWTVTAPATPDAMIRITTPTQTAISDVSDKTFYIDLPPRCHVDPASLSFSAPQNGPLPAIQTVVVSNTGGGSLTWAAQWTNPAWMSVSPVNQSGNTTNMQVSIINTSMPEGTYYDTIRLAGNASNSPVAIPITYVITSKRLFSVSGIIKNAAGPLPVSMGGITVNASGPVVKSTTTNDLGEYTIGDLPEGTYVIFPDDPYLEFTPDQRKYDPLDAHVYNADFDAAGVRGEMTLQYKEGWNLLSIPLIVSEKLLTALLPDADPPAYYYDRNVGYVITDSLTFGPGYWVKFSKEGSVKLNGILKRSLMHTLSSEKGGWNLVGTPSAVVELTHVVQQPPGSILAIYDFDPGAGYIAPYGGFIYPGRAYWIKVGVDATIEMVPATGGGPIRANNINWIPGAKVTPPGDIPR
jgi:hypothetical protein